MKVTIFKNIRETNTGFVRDVTAVFDRIRNGKNRDLVDLIRFEVDKEKRDLLKQNLPSVCFSGSFSSREKKGLKKHSGLICLDFDKFPNKDTLQAARDTIEGDEYVFACFLSPSYNGLKVVVKIPPKAEMHKQYFDALQLYFNSPYFDVKTSDVSRVCYESFDPNLYHNPDSRLWVEGEEVDLVSLGTETPLIAVSSENRIITNLLKWWEKKYGSRKGERNSNLFILAIAMHDFGVAKIECENTLIPFTEKDFSDREIRALISSAYKNDATFGTRFFEDFYKRKNIEKEIINGKSLSEIKKQFPEIKEIEQVARNIKDTVIVDEFWTFTDKGKFKLVHHKFKKYLHQNNIFKYIPNKEGESIFINIKENKVSITTPDQIKDLVLKDLELRKGIGMTPFDEMAEATKYFGSNYLSFIDTIEISLKKDTQDASYLYYSNSAIKVTKGDIECIEYIDLDGFVWDKQVINRDFVRVDTKKSEFKRFVWLISGQDDHNFNSIRSAIGYLLSSFKTSANNKAVILNDEVISENPNGGSGKGLLSNAIGHIKKVASIDGKLFKFDNNFLYQTVSADCQIVNFDDVKKNFPFEMLFSLITEGITIEKKGMDAIKIPIENSPKVMISTNYTIGGIGGSFDRRKFEIELSAYFGSHHSPVDEFGHMLFGDWGVDEWNRFDCFMIECLQYFLANGLVKSEYKNLEVRKFISSTSNEFYQWSQDRESLPLGIRFSRAELFDSIISEYPDLKKWLTQKRFAAWIKMFADFYGYSYSEGRTNGQRWSVIGDSDTLDGETPVLDTSTPF